MNVTNSLGGEIITYAKSNLKMSVDNGAVSLNMNVPQDTLTMYSSNDTTNNININSRDSLFLNSSNVYATASHDMAFYASNNINIAAGNQVNMQFNSFNMSTLGDQAYTAASNIVINNLYSL